MNYITKNAANDFETFFDDVFGNWGIRNSTFPSVDVYEDDKAFYIEAELAGYEMDDIDVNVEKHVLHISSDKVNGNKDRKYVLRERTYVKFNRSFTLPEGINEENISAQFRNGILTVTLPKMPIEKPRKISVSIN